MRKRIYVIAKGKNYNVKELVSILKKKWKGFNWEIKKEKHSLYESNLLKLNSKKAKKILNWRTKLNFKETVIMTADWYKQYTLRPKTILSISKKQIEDYQKRI